MTTWNIPPRIKIYEALGAIADGRVSLTEGGATVTSSSGNKSYRVTFDPATNEIQSNDNASFWTGYLGYPAVAYLLLSGRLSYDPHLAEPLAGIPWKDVNTRFKNDYGKTEQYVREHLAGQGASVDAAERHADTIRDTLAGLALVKGKASARPPAGY